MEVIKLGPKTIGNNTANTVGDIGSKGFGNIETKDIGNTNKDFIGNIFANMSGNIDTQEVRNESNNLQGESFLNRHRFRLPSSDKGMERIRFTRVIINICKIENLDFIVK